MKIYQTYINSKLLEIAMCDVLIKVLSIVKIAPRKFGCIILIIWKQVMI